MGDIKSVIALLCKHLKLSFNVNIRPEHFRLSKFDKMEDNSVCQMWEILYKICSEVFPVLVEDDVVVFVKISLAMLGYSSIELYCLPPDMSAGSRELLLALGWLIATQSILENSVSNRLRDSPLNMEFDNVNAEEHASGTSLRVHSTGSPESALRSVLWIAGKIRHNINMIAELDQARVSYAAKIHKGSANASGLPHLSVSETKLVRSPQLLPQYLSQVSSKAALVDTHKQWGKKCHVFWEWMETVIAEKESAAELSHVSVEEKKAMLVVLDALRSRIKCMLTKTRRPVREEPRGVPRCILQARDKGLEMEALLQDSEQQVRDMQQACSLRHRAVELRLHEIAEQLQDVTVLFSS